MRGGMWSLYAGENILAQVPTLEMWEKLEQVLDFKAPDDLKGFVFNPQMGFTNVWKSGVELDLHWTPKKLCEIEALSVTA
jgi:hypothetical protein